MQVDYRTCALNNTAVNVLSRVESTPPYCFGCLQIVQTVEAFNKVRLGTGELLERCECSLPPLEHETVG
jgi:hypothetical protein